MENKNWAAITIDMQEGALELYPRDLVDKAIAEQKRVFKHAKEQGFLRAHVTYKSLYTDDDYFYFGRLHKDLPRSRAPRLAPEFLNPIREFEKNSESIFDAYSYEHILKWLDRNNVKGLILTGVEAGSCVRVSADDAISYGYAVVVPEKAILDLYELDAAKEYFYEIGTLKKFSELPIRE